MYLVRKKFKREKDSKWEVGYFIGESENPGLDKGCWLDESFQPLPRDNKGYQIWEDCWLLDGSEIELRLG